MTLSAILRAVADAERYPPGPVADAERNPRAPAVALSPTRGAGLQTLLKPLSSIGHIGLLILTLLKPLSSIGRYVSGAEHMSRGPGTAVSAHSGAKCFAPSIPEVALVYLWYRL